MSKKPERSGPIPLSTMIAAVRSELKQAEREAQGDDLRFEVQEVELELAVTVEHSATAGVGVKVWVIEAGADGTLMKGHSHTVKVKLKPVGDPAKRGTTDVLVSGEGVRPGARGDVPMGG